jgi:D-alanine-D-alanine ligase
MGEFDDITLPRVSCDPGETPLILLCGGSSGERDISLISGKGVERALRDEGFPVEVLDPADRGFLSKFSSAVESGTKAVFICLHGKGGEDGTVQGLCELVKIPYTGPGVLASALAMDKARSKVMYAANSLPTPNSLSISRGSTWNIDQIVSAVGEKCVVKPATEGSAIGVTIVHESDDLSAAIESALSIDDLVIVERFVEGTEITVAVLGNDEPFALPVIEIVPRNEFYDFDAKYSNGGAKHIIPARLDEQAMLASERNAILAHKALGCTGVSRSDFIVDDEGTPWILETNTIPGMTETSLLPDAASKLGISYRQLCHMLIDFALEEHASDR